MTVCVGNINAGSLRVETVQSLLAVRHLYTDLIFETAGPYLDVGRNKVVDRFWREYDDDYLLFVDSDIKFTSENFEALLSLAAPDRIVSGVYKGVFPDLGVRTVACRWGWDERQNTVSLVPIADDVLEEADDNGLVKVDGIGAGFMIFHRELVSKMLETFDYPMPWFYEAVLERNKQWVGEDLMFCLRAEMLGVYSYVAPGINVGHIKQMELR